MSRDVFVDENEINIAVNKIDSYVNFLLRSIDDCNGELNKLVSYGIKDEGITKQIETVMNRLRVISASIDEGVLDFRNDARKFKEGMHSADRFIYGDVMIMGNIFNK